MLKSERKVRAVINNAICYQRIRHEFGSFCDYLWAYTGGKTILYEGHAEGAVPVSNGLSDTISRDLKKRGLASLTETMVLVSIVTIITSVLLYFR